MLTAVFFFVYSTTKRKVFSFKSTDSREVNYVNECLLSTLDDFIYPCVFFVCRLKFAHRECGNRAHGLLPLASPNKKCFVCRSYVRSFRTSFSFSCDSQQSRVSNAPRSFNAWHKVNATFNDHSNEISR